jgi:hypothetical protein
MPYGSKRGDSQAPALQELDFIRGLTQNQGLARDRLGESRRMAPFSLPEPHVVHPEPHVMHSNTTTTPRSVWELKTLHTNTNDRISYRKPTADSRHLIEVTYCSHLPLAVRISPAR